ncbi:MAG: ribonuclease H-like domain-containing protein [Planctomycetota bacterium]
MLTASFIFAPGMTEEMERALWARGVTSWATLGKHPGEAEEAIGKARTQKLLTAVNEAQAALDAGDGSWFANHWPSKESWRLWRGLCSPEQVALLDIETTGRTPGYDQITVIGLSDGSRERAFVADRPLNDDEVLSAFPDEIKPYRLLVTYNGIGFDVPFIEKHFRTQGFSFAIPHIDLMWPARSLGLSGGLKDMEKQVGIARSGDIADMRGAEAITLWGAWKRGDRAAYDKLVTYCKADCTNLKDFADIVYQRKWDQVYTPHAADIDLDSIMGEQTSLF